MPSGNIQRSIQGFISTVVSTENSASAAPTESSSLRASRRTLGTGSWIVNDLNSTQRQLQNFVDANFETQYTAPSVMDAHPRQSAGADFQGSYSNSQITSPRDFNILSPSTQEQTAANIIEGFLERELDLATSTIRSDPHFDVANLNQSGVPLQQLQQILRGSAGIQNNINIGTNSRVNNALRNKIVFKLNCAYCKIPVCDRAMRAILLSDTKVELYSTDIPPKAVVTMNEDRMTGGCNCRIRDTVCTGCGNVLGYHVSQPCDRCLDARNNGHFWMFCSEGVSPSERMHFDGNGPLYWTSLPPMSDFVPASSCIIPNQAGNATYESFCR